LLLLFLLVGERDRDLECLGERDLDLRGDLERFGDLDLDRSRGECLGDLDLEERVCRLGGDRDERERWSERARVGVGTLLSCEDVGSKFDLSVDVDVEVDELDLLSGIEDDGRTVDEIDLLSGCWIDEFGDEDVTTESVVVVVVVVVESSLEKSALEKENSSFEFSPKFVFGFIASTLGVESYKSKIWLLISSKSSIFASRTSHHGLFFPSGKSYFKNFDAR